MTSFIIFTVIAIVAHILVWQWRPWLPGPNGYASIVNGVQRRRDRSSCRSWHRRRTTCGESGCCSIRAATLVALFTFLFVLALLIHFILLSTDRFNWLDGPRAKRRGQQMTAPPPAPTPVEVAAANEGSGRGPGARPVRSRRRERRHARTAPASRPDWRT